MIEPEVIGKYTDLKQDVLVRGAGMGEDESFALGIDVNLFLSLHVRLLHCFDARLNPPHAAKQIP